MNAVLHIEGSEAAIISSLADMRKHGIAFVTCEREKKTEDNPINKGVWRSSREMLASWTTPPMGREWICDIYFYVRERDVELAMICSRGKTEVVSRQRKIAETGV